MVSINEELVFAFLIVLWIIYRLFRRLTAGRTSLRRELLLSLFFVYSCLVFHLTFFPMNIVLYAFDPYDANLVPFVETVRMLRYIDQPAVIRNLLGNLILLAPLGFFLPVFFSWLRRARRVLAVGCLVSLSIELFQLFLAVRVFDIDDLLLNTLGVSIGFLIFWLLNKITYLTGQFERMTGARRYGQERGMAAYGLLALLAFLSIYSIQIMQQTKTEQSLIQELPATHRQLLDNPKFADFMLVFSQSEPGNKAVEIYRRVFFNRYTLFQWQDNIQLEENHYSVSGTSSGHAMNYFIIARSQQKIAAMTSGEQRFPVVRVGEYYFSYARLPLREYDRYFSFRFMDANGIEIRLSIEE